MAVEDECMTFWNTNVGPGRTSVSCGFIFILFFFEKKAAVRKILFLFEKKDKRLRRNQLAEKEVGQGPRKRKEVLQ